MGRRYREAVNYNVSGQTCRGCDVCLNCPEQRCPRIDPSCVRYTRTTDRRGCVLCPFCAVWSTAGAPSVVGNGRFGFLQVRCSGLKMSPLNLMTFPYCPIELINASLLALFWYEVLKPTKYCKLRCNYLEPTRTDIESIDTSTYG